MKDIFIAMMDDDFQIILKNDKILNDLESQKNNQKDQYFQLMMIFSKVFRIGNIHVSCITPAIWSYLYSIGNAYVTHKKIEKIDTDIFVYILSKGIKNLSENLVQQAFGFCEKNNLDYQITMLDLQYLIYISFRPLQMLNTTKKDKQIRYNADWLTSLISIVSPLTNKDSEYIMYDMSLTECYSYFIQYARQFDDKEQIKRHNSDQIIEAIYKRTLELGKQYYQTNYKDKK